MLGPVRAVHHDGEWLVAELAGGRVHVHLAIDTRRGSARDHVPVESAEDEAALREAVEAALRAKGTYVLLLPLGAVSDVELGRARRVVRVGPLVAYAGSAWGSGGLGARIGHHANPDKKRVHFDADALTALAGHTFDVVLRPGAPAEDECALARALGLSPRALVTLGAGNKDCAPGARCAGHVISLPTEEWARARAATRTRRRRSRSGEGPG